MKKKIFQKRNIGFYCGKLDLISSRKENLLWEEEGVGSEVFGVRKDVPFYLRLFRVFFKICIAF